MYILQCYSKFVVLRVIIVEKIEGKGHNGERPYPCTVTKNRFLV